MSQHLGKGNNTRHGCFRGSQAWSFFGRNNIADDFDGRTLVVGGKDLPPKEEPDISGTSTEGIDEEAENLQVHFVGNTIKLREAENQLMEELYNQSNNLRSIGGFKEAPTKFKKYF